MNAEAVRLGAVSALGMAVCCTLTALVTAGAVSVAVAWMSGSIGLAVVAVLLICSAVVARKRNTGRARNEGERSDVTTDRAAS